MQRLLILDDDAELIELLSQYLTGEGFIVAGCSDPRDLDKHAIDSHDLLILDVMMPGMSGFDVLRKLRATSSIPVIMLTARGEEVDRIVGLELGADDYLAKPFNPRELAARIRAVFRRARTPEPGNRSTIPPVLLVGDIRLDIGTRRAFVRSEEIPLTAVEFKLLEVLLRSAGQVVKRNDLAMQVLERTLSYEDRSLDVHVSNLRRKIGNKTEHGSRIQTIRGVGYLYAVSSESNAA